MTDQERIDALMSAARETGFTIDFLDQLSMGLSSNAFRRFIGNALMSPSYMKSKESPYVFRSARAPSRPIR